MILVFSVIVFAVQGCAEDSAGLVQLFSSSGAENRSGGYQDLPNVSIDHFQLGLVHPEDDTGHGPCPSTDFQWESEEVIRSAVHLQLKVDESSEGCMNPVNNEEYERGREEYGMDPPIKPNDWCVHSLSGTHEFKIGDVVDGKTRLSRDDEMSIDLVAEMKSDMMVDRRKHIYVHEDCHSCRYALDSGPNSECRVSVDGFSIILKLPECGVSNERTRHTMTELEITPSLLWVLRCISGNAFMEITVRKSGLSGGQIVGRSRFRFELLARR